MDRISPVACALSLLIACEEPPTTARPASQVPLEATAPRVPTPEKWVKRTDLELDDLLKSTCDAAVQDQKPILLEFSAAWCVDCRRLVELSSQPEVRDELARFHHVTVDVGQWDRHQALTKAFGVGMLAWWAVLTPTDCSAPIPTWPRRAEGGFEPSSSGQGARTAEDVLSWLRHARTAEPKAP
jgi:thiol-disulfide isomerase/thioredoxin